MGAACDIDRHDVPAVTETVNVGPPKSVGPFDESARSLAEGGYVRAIGLSEVGLETVRRAQAVHPISDPQIEYSLVRRGSEAAIR